MQIKISPNQIQRQILAPVMQQSIELLLLPLTELNMAIEQELQNNPLLEVVEEEKNASIDQVEAFLNSPLNTSTDYNPQQRESFTDDEEHTEAPISRPVPLEDYLLEQLHLEFSDPLEIKIGELIIGNLDEEGYLHLSCEEIAHMLELKDTELAEKVLTIIQHFEPLGIAARDLKECLFIQSNFLFNGKGNFINSIIKDYFELLGKRKYVEIAKKLKASVDEVKEAARCISALEPRPARKYRPLPHNIYVKPDIRIEKNEADEFVIIINQHSLPTLRINPIYQKMLKKGNLTQEEKDFIREKIKNGLMFIKGIEQRHHTVREIAQHILSNQREFFELGETALRPMTLKDVAVAIGRNESTICRAISNKYMETPQGFFPVKFFFSQSVSENDHGDGVSNRSVKEIIRRLIDEEDKTKPLSDQEVQHHLSQQGLRVARRTINKYRQALNILPSHLRKN